MTHLLELKTNLAIATSLFLYSVEAVQTGYSQHRGMHHHNGRKHHEDWPSGLQTVTVSGQAEVDSGHFHPLYFLESKDGTVDYQLGFGPDWYESESGATRQQDGADVTVTGGVVESHTPPLIVVFEIDGLVWRDSSSAPPWSGGWVHRNASDTTFIYCPTDSLDRMGYPPQSMHGMMFPDSIYCQFEEMPVDSMPGMVDSSFFEGYYTENFSGHGNHMRGGGMMMGFNRDIRIRFHYDADELYRRQLAEESIEVRYLDSNSGWQRLSGATLDTETNTVVISQANVRTFYALTASSVTSVRQSEKGATPEAFTLFPNFPSPFNPQTTIRYQLARDANIWLDVYDVRGQVVKNLYRGKQQAGEYAITWDGTDETGRLVANGVYLSRLQSGSISQVRKMTLLK